MSYANQLFSRSKKDSHIQSLHPTQTSCAGEFDDMWKLRIAILAFFAAVASPLSFADSVIEVSAKIVGFHIDPFFPTEAKILNDDGSVFGNTILHGPCAVAKFEMIEPKSEQGNPITVNFTDGRFQKNRQKKKMEERVKNGAIYTFSVPADYFETEYESIDGVFVRNLKIAHIKSVDTTPISAPR